MRTGGGIYLLFSFRWIGRPLSRRAMKLKRVSHRLWRNLQDVPKFRRHLHYVFTNPHQERREARQRLD